LHRRLVDFLIIHIVRPKGICPSPNPISGKLFLKFHNCNSQNIKESVLLYNQGSQFVEKVRKMAQKIAGSSYFLHANCWLLEFSEINGTRIYLILIFLKKPITQQFYGF
jgi:hypothetical protein